MNTNKGGSLLMRLYCKKFECKVLAYCLMDTHVHIQLDPKG